MSRHKTPIATERYDDEGQDRQVRPVLLGVLAAGGLIAGSLAIAAPASATPGTGGTSDEREDAESEGDDGTDDPASEDDAAGADDPAGEGDADTLAPTMLILDASGSMAADDGDASGMTRMEAAQQAVTELAGAAPDRAPLGLVVYGANVSSAPEDQEAGCEDIEVLASPEPGQAGEITSTVSGVEASGYTPIGESLRVADGELPDDGERSIILVSDGIDTCAPPPPCEVAEELNDAGVDLTLHAIGFKVDDEARADLECIADAGGGTYADAEDAEELAAEMERAAMRGMRGYEMTGTPIDGGETPMQAPQVEPGDYTDTLEEGGASLVSPRGTEKYYRIPLDEGERAHVTATMLGPDGNRSVLSGGPDNASLSMSVGTDEGNSCEGIGASSGASLNINTGLMAWGITAPMGSEDCEGSELYLEVRRSGSLMADTPFDLELLVRTEPAGLDASAMPPPATEADEEDLITSLDPGDGDGELFGTSFGEATLIEPGTHTARIVHGEMNFVRIPVEYGQTLRFAAEIQDGPDPDLGVSFDDVGRFTASLFNPLRQNVTLWDGEELTGGVRTNTDVGNSFAANLATPVNFNNREGEVEELTPVYLGGEYYLGIGFEIPLSDTDADADQHEWTYTLAVEVDGEPVDGPQVQDWDTQAADDDEAGSGGDLAGNSETDKQDDGPDLSAQEEDTSTAAGGDQQAPADDGGAVWPFIAGGGILLLLAAGGGWLAVRQLRA